jgi:hypothetical protein
MNARRLLLLALLTTSCAQSSTPQSGTPPASHPDPDTGVADVPPSVAPSPEAGSPDNRAGCPAGATAEDCQLCEYGGESCKRACPKVDCNVYPPPAECAPFCGTDDCCECRLDVGTEYWWRPPRRAIACGTSCGATRAAWQALMDDPRMKACTVDEDCAQAGGPTPPSCDCRPAIGGCYQAVNAAAYQRLGAASIEQQYLASCASEGRTCDCAPGVPGCLNGACVMKRMFCCLCPPDAGRD